LNWRAAYQLGPSRVLPFEPWATFCAEKKYIIGGSATNTPLQQEPPKWTIDASVIAQPYAGGPGNRRYGGVSGGVRRDKAI
jgi:hypothetical protein